MSFDIRGFNMCESLLRHTPEQLRRFIRRMKDLQFNTLIVHYDYGWRRYRELILEEAKAAGVEITLMTFGPRTFFSYTDWKPEWFAKDESGQPHTRELECETQPCRFQPEALEAYAYGAQQWLKSLPPEIVRVHMRAGDGLKFCRCGECRKLPDHEKWQPFVEVFANAALECRPDLEFETDIYVKRYNLPADLTAHRSMQRIMYDTFYRQPQVPIGMPLHDRDSVYYAASEANPDAVTVNEYHRNRLGEWCRECPGRMYIHENAMGQSFQGVFQHNTGALLQDLRLYRQLGVRGVCYEAYEPGYGNFREQFEILSAAMRDPAVIDAYEYTPLEEALPQRPQMKFFCDELEFPLQEFLKDEHTCRHVDLFRRNFVTPSPQNYREYLDFAMAHAGTLDPLMIGMFNAKWGIYKNRLNFSKASPGAKELLCHTKLWDYMEKIPQDRNPIDECRQLVCNLAESVL